MVTVWLSDRIDHGLRGESSYRYPSNFFFNRAASYSGRTGDPNPASWSWIDGHTGGRIIIEEREDLNFRAPEDSKGSRCRKSFSGGLDQIYISSKARARLALIRA